MQEREFVTSAAGVKMPRLIYGTAWKETRTAELVLKAVRAGFKGIDTACQPKHYAEEGVGKALQLLQKEGIPRESLYVQTKFTPLSGQDPKNIPYDKEAPLTQQVRQSFARSQQNLQTSYVDALILHTPIFPFAHLLSVWRAMEAIHNEGGARQLGISNCYDLSVLKKLFAEAEVKPAVLQNRFYSDTDYDKELRQWCAEQGVLYESFWSLTANPHLLGSETLMRLAMKHHKSEAQIFFAFLIALGIIPLSGTTSETHMREDLSVFEITLTPDEIASIQQLL